MLARHCKLALLAVGVALLCLGFVSATTEAVSEPLPLSNAMQGVADSVGSLLDDFAVVKVDEPHTELLETSASTEVDRKHRPRRALRRAARKARKLGRKLRKAGSRKQRRNLKRKLRKARRNLKKGGRNMKRKLRRFGKKLRRRIGKKGRRLSKKLRRRLGKKTRRHGKKARRHGKKARRHGKKLNRRAKKLNRRAARKLRRAAKGYKKNMRKQDHHVKKLDSKVMKTAQDFDKTLGSAAVLHVRMGQLQKAQRDVMKHKAHYDKVKKRFHEYQKKAADRRAEMAKVKPYKGKLQVGSKKQGKNHMHGGPMTRASRNLSSLQRYQLKVLEREAKRQDDPNKARISLVHKIRRLYGKAKPKMGGFMLNLLQNYGVKTTAAEAKQKWVLARNRYVQKLRLKAEKKYLKEQEKIAKKEKKAQEHKEALAFIAKHNAELNKPRKFKLAKDPNWLDEYPKNRKKMNWWGCIDCLPEKTLKKQMAKDAAKAKAKAKAKVQKLQKKAKKQKKKGIFSKVGRALKKAKNAVKKVVKKITGKKKTKKVNLRERTLSTGKKIVIPKNLPIPKYDPTPKNANLLQSLLEEYKVHKSVGEVRSQARSLMKKMRTAIVMSMLSQKETEEILRAKTEELEKVISNRADFPVMVKGSIPHYKPPSKIPFPDIKQGSVREDPRTMDWQVDVVSANGYLEKPWRTDRHALDSGDEMHQLSRRDHEAFMKRYRVLPDIPVWKQFDGDGDAAQLRHEEVNQWRKKNPNQPLEDGTDPW